MFKYVRKTLNWYAGLWPKHLVKPPYKHVVQLGDPVLRRKCENIDLSSIQSNEIKAIIQKMKQSMKQYNLFGIAAPQIGVNKRIIIFQLNEQHLKETDERIIEKCGFSKFPMTVFINPRMKITNHKKLSFKEGCASIKGYSAEVSRYEGIYLDAYNEEGKEIGLHLSTWLARIAQHEMDHLEGQVFTDIMDTKTLMCTCWEEVNLYEGKVRLPYDI